MALQNGSSSESRDACTHDNDVMLFLGRLKGQFLKCSIHGRGYCRVRECWRLEPCNDSVLILMTVYFVSI